MIGRVFLSVVAPGAPSRVSTLAGSGDGYCCAGFVVFFVAHLATLVGHTRRLVYAGTARRLSVKPRRMSPRYYSSVT